MKEAAISAARSGSADAAESLAALRAGDERVFERLVAAHHAALVRLAAHYVGGAAIAEEVAQETWLAFLESLDRFEGRASLKTWLFRILLNCARSRRRAEVRTVPFSAAWSPEADGPEPAAVDRARFQDDGIWAGHWSVPPKAWNDDGERLLLSGELRSRLQEAIDKLPPAQREVIVLRDVEGLSGEEVCELLDLSEANQRVLLHRARARVRSVLEGYLELAKGTP